jgi:hypothetical protein
VPSSTPALGAAAFLAHEVVHGRDGLLVGRGTGVEHVLGQLFTLVLNGVEQQAVHFFHHRQHRLARYGRPATEDDGNLVLAQQLLGLFGEQRPVGGWIHHDGLELLAQQAALGVDVVNGHQHRVLQHRFRDGHGAGQAVQHAHLDGVLGLCLRLGGEGQCARCHGSGGSDGLEMSSTIHGDSPE